MLAPAAPSGPFRSPGRDTSHPPPLCGGEGQKRLLETHRPSGGQTESTSSERGAHWEPPAGLWLRPCLPRTMLSQRCSCPKFRSVLKGFMLICFLAKNVSTLGVVFK